jgi:crossover junction endodeoxyribonuclease RuvC
MLVIGIDPGTATTGYGVIEENDSGSILLVAYGVIKTDPGLGPGSRLRKISEELTELLNFHQPKEAAVEKLFFQRNVTNAIAVGQARGVVLLALANFGIPAFEYTPTEVKHIVTSYGAAGKEQVQKMVQSILRMDVLPEPDDAADALAIAIAHIHSNSYKNLKSIENN